MSDTDQPQASTPALDSFLRGARLRRVTGPELSARMHDLFLPEPEQPAGALDLELLPHRIMVMWRLVRVTACAIGLCSEDESLDEATEIEPSPWTNPYRPSMLPSTKSALRRGQADRLLQLRTEGEGLPLLPPRNDPEALDRWCRAASIIAAGLGVERHPEGLLGLQGLTDPATARYCDVTVPHLLQFEDMLMEETLDLLLDVGERSSTRHLRDAYGFTGKEVLALFRLAKTQALARSAASIEEKRALQEARLENFIGRAKEHMNMDDEMKAIKELAKIQGLTRSEPESQAAEFLEAVRRESRRQDEQLAERTARVVDLIPNGTEDVEPIRLEAPDHDDAEAVAEYDRENQRK